MGGAYPELNEQRPAIEKWLSSEEESFGRTLAQGMSTLGLYIDQARDAGRTSVPAAEVFRLHDTYGFPYELTSELLAEEGLSIEGDFERPDGAAARSRSGERADAGAEADSAREAASSFAGESGVATRFTGYETEEQQTTMAAVQGISANGARRGGRRRRRAPSGPATWSS